MKSLYNYIMESTDSITLDLNDENVTEKILQFAKEHGVNVTVDEQKKVIKSNNIYITTQIQDNTTVIWLNDRNSFLGPHIYLIPNKEWTFVTHEIIFSSNKPMDGSLINIDRSSKLKKVSLMSAFNQDVFDCIAQCSIETFNIFMGMTPSGFEKSIQHLNIKRLVYSSNEYTRGFNPNAKLNCNELVIKGVRNTRSSKKSDPVTIENCPCVSELTTLLSNNPQLKVIINWQFDGVFSQVYLEDGELKFHQLDTYNQNTAFRKCK